MTTVCPQDLNVCNAGECKSLGVSFADAPPQTGGVS
jgi:hypothetical protein